MTPLQHRTFFHLFFPLSSRSSTIFKEYKRCYELFHNTVPHTKSIPSNPSFGESLCLFAVSRLGLHSFSTLVLHRSNNRQMMPPLMMWRRQIPRAQWCNHSTHNRKHWIEQVHPTKIHLRHKRLTTILISHAHFPLSPASAQPTLYICIVLSFGSFLWALLCD
jgi:hypothetical protein